MSSPNPDPRIEALFHEALERAPEDREAFVAEASSGDESLQRQVRRLLAAPQEAGTCFEPINSPEIEAELARLKPEEAGEVIGSYTLIEEIGEGGFGRVWIAEQKVPVRRRVALKILKLGMDTKDVLARFEQERQALALMDHPSIAKVFDAGATQWGRPFVVMELVDGVKITEFCDRLNLPMRERLELFIAVCQAVQHAHQKGVIHRDLKPSNILVTLQDGVPVPKVIDFGVAKATQQRLTDLTVYTQIEQMIGTPPYMSPEQAEANGLNVDTRTDIYALGVLLYELLTSRPPFDATTLMQASYEEMRRIIREKEPPKPSTALNTMAPNVLTEVARHRQSEPPTLIHTVRGDLDWIVMKALEKDRARRYETANGFALDVQRHLQSEPVVARPPSRMYRFGRLVRRNRLVFAAASAAAAALIIGLSVALVSLFNEQEALFNERKARAGEAEQRKLAEERGRQAIANEMQARRFRYAAEMNLAQEALRVNNLGRARRLLDQHRPKAGEQDLRGWEWRYLWQQCRSGAIATLTKHTARVLSVSFSADSKLLAVAFLDGRLEIWDVLSRKLLSAVQNDEPIGNPISSNQSTTRLGQVRFGPQGYFLAQILRNKIKLHDFGSKEEPTSVDLGAAVRAFSFSRDGTLLICFTDAKDAASGQLRAINPNLQYINVALRKVVEANLPSYVPAPRSGGDVRYSPDGTRYYLATQLGRRLCVSVFRTSQDAAENEFKIGEDDKLSAIDVSPDGKLLVTGTGWERSEIQVWDTMTAKLITKLDRHTAWIPEVAFSPDGLSLASASGDQTVRIWDTHTWEERAVLRGHGSEVWALAFSPDGTLLASGGKDGEVLLWSSDPPPTARARFDFPDDIRFAAPLPDETWILTASTVSGLSVWHSVTLAETPLRFRPNDLLLNLMRGRRPEMVKRSPDGRFQATPHETGSVTLHDLTAGREITLLGHLLGVGAVAFTPDGKRLVSVSGGREAAKLWDTDTGQELLNLSGRGVNLYCADFSTDGDVLLVGSYPIDGPTQLWRAPSWVEIEAAERSSVFWPPKEVLAIPMPTLPQAELKDLVERAQHKWPQAVAASARSPVSLEGYLASIDQPSALNEQNALLFLVSATKQAWSGRNSDHLATSRRVLKLAASTKNAAVASRVAKLYCLRPSADPQLLETTVALARKAVSLGQGQPDLPWYQLTLGIAEYRNENFRVAAEVLNDAMRAAAAKLDFGQARLTAAFFRAMSLFGQGKEIEAREGFTQAEAKMKPLPSDDNNPMAGGADHDDLILWLAYKEAKALLQTKE